MIRTVNAAEVKQLPASGDLTATLLGERDAFVALCDDGNWILNAPTFLGFDRDQWMQAGNPDHFRETLHEALPGLCGMSDIIARWRREDTVGMLEDDCEVSEHWNTGDVIAQWHRDHPQIVAQRKAGEVEQARIRAEQYLLTARCIAERKT